MSIKHIKTATGADDPDPNKIQASDWNNSHTVDNLGLTIPSNAPGNITTPSAGNVTLFIDSSNDFLSQLDSTGAVISLVDLGVYSPVATISYT